MRGAAQRGATSAGALVAAVVAAALVALGLFLFVLDDDPTAGDDTGSPTSSPLPDRDGCIEVVIAASPEKAGVLAANVEAYNATDPQVGGSCVVAQVLRKGSGTAAAAPRAARRSRSHGSRS